MNTNTNGVVKSAIVGLVGLLMITVGLIVFPIVITGADNVRLATNVSQFTGITQFNGIVPLIVYVVWLFLGAFAAFMGGRGIYKGTVGGE